MSNNIDKMRRELLQETNYRCGYCMRNITPRVYYLDDNKDKPKYDYIYLNIFDRSHIIPNEIANDKFKDFYNLIALCKSCHWEIDHGTLDTLELKRLKLHWMIASGRFTRMEIQFIENLFCYDNKIQYTEKNALEVYLQSWANNIHAAYKADVESQQISFTASQQIKKFNDEKSNVISYKESIILPPNIEALRVCADTNGKMHFVYSHSALITNNLYFLLQNLIKYHLITLIYVRESLNFAIKEDSLVVYLSDNGKEFCTKFSDVHETQ